MEEVVFLGIQRECCAQVLDQKDAFSQEKEVAF